MYTINYYSVTGRPRGGIVKGNVGWRAALEDLYKAPRACKIAEVTMGNEVRRYERTLNYGWKRL